MCEIIDSYGLPVSVYGATDLQTWIAKYFQTLIRNNRSIQAITVPPVGIMLCLCKTRSQRIDIKQFSSHDFISNDHYDRFVIRKYWFKTWGSSMSK